METTKNNLPENTVHFFNELSRYLETKLYFFGSVQRSDYLHGVSDIDVDVFTNNMDAMIHKLQHFLHVPRSKFKKMICRLQLSNRLVSGYKVYYQNDVIGIITEISIYNEQYKTDVLTTHKLKTSIPFYVSWILVIMKTLYYKFNIIDTNVYKYIKGKALSTLIGLKEDDFMVLSS